MIILAQIVFFLKAESYIYIYFQCVCCLSEEIYNVGILRENWQCLQRILIFIVVSIEWCYHIKAMYDEALTIF